MDKELFIRNFINCLLKNEEHLSDGYMFYTGAIYNPDEECTIQLLNKMATEIYDKTMLNIEIKEE